MTDDEAMVLLEAARVRVWDAQHAGIFCEGKVIAVCLEPSITVVDDEGNRHHHSLSLPVDVEQREWVPRQAATRSRPEASA